MLTNTIPNMPRYDAAAWDGVNWSYCKTAAVTTQAVLPAVIAVFTGAILRDIATDTATEARPARRPSMSRRDCGISESWR